MARRHGLRISAPVQNFVELAEQLDLVDLVMVGDHYVRRDVDSPMETRLRMLIVLAGLPEPVVNHKLVTEDGRVRYRFDLSWPEVRVAVEYDGRQHRDDLDQWDHGGSTGVRTRRWPGWRRHCARTGVGACRTGCRRSGARTSR